mmetsp:Transcript_62792/g.166653  ORF Transcript_62792/g.166653 Transcript_62792/m.166653 type:complete len:108 (-) Transcript_62792:200-523(-)
MICPNTTNWEHVPPSQLPCLTFHRLCVLIMQMAVQTSEMYPEKKASQSQKNPGRTQAANAKDNFGEVAQLVGISVLSVIVASITVTPVTVMLRLAASAMNAAAIVSL